MECKEFFLPPKSHDSQLIFVLESFHSVDILIVKTCCYNPAQEVTTSSEMEIQPTELSIHPNTVPNYNPDGQRRELFKGDAQGSKGFSRINI